MNIAVICSAHGFGHVGRQLAVVERLLMLGHHVVLYTAAPADLLRIAIPTTGTLTVVPWRVDVGIAQHDSLTEDLEATRVLWTEATQRIDALADALRGIDHAVVDVAPTALEACRRAGVPALAVGNFDWAWIYAHYPELSEFAPQMQAWQAHHPAVALAPGPGMHGFASVRSVAHPLARRASPFRPDVPGKAVLVAFGGLGLANLESWLPRMAGVTWVLAPPSQAVERADVVYVEGVPFPSLLAGVDAVLTKPGYGVLAEAMLCGTRLCWVDRGQFPEAPYLERAMVDRGDVKVAGGAAGVEAAVGEALTRGRPAPQARTAVDEVVEARLPPDAV